ncbi:hypothetical protein BC835DRAFT_1275755 [Cytidiella melzeri]|nr:hypothetical protein BC835DRAFT_1275755 [Cytidiella melzeri]
MPSARYAPLPNPRNDPDAQDEMEAAFLDSDEEEDETQLPRARNGYQRLSAVEHADSPLHATVTNTTSADARIRSSAAPANGTYDFENVDYDADWMSRPPPGSPPPATDILRNFRESQGNTNGLVPDFSDAARLYARRFGGQQQRAGVWLRSIVPPGVATRLGMRREGGSAPVVGGGLSNDGVFANVTAKPSRAIQIQDGENIYLVPEEAQKEAPPSYASAQADAVPPYWETTIHAPSASTAPGDMIVDSLPTGSLFSFLWNMLVSISFQFVGFLLTYLLHTTHAAKLGSRAGLGITLIQYGFAMRSRAEEWAKEGVVSSDNVDGWPFAPPPSNPTPTFGTAAEAEEYYRNLNITSDTGSTMDVSSTAFFGDATTEWLSFFLMTVGWFILLTSLLSFWRVKRWERGILASSPSSSLPAPASSSSAPSSRSTLFGRINLLRTGLGFPVSDFPGAGASSSRPSGGDGPPRTSRSIFDDAVFNVNVRDDGDLEEVSSDPRGTYVIPIDESNPERTHRLARAYADEARLQRDLRAAGLL